MAESFEAIEVLDGAAALAFGLGAVAEHETDTVRFFCNPAEALGYAVVPILLVGDFNIAVTDHARVRGAGDRRGSPGRHLCYNLRFSCFQS